MMKKLLVAIAALSVTSMVASADIFVNWRAQAGFYDNGSAGAYPGDGILFPSGTALVQLLWSPDATTTGVDPLGANFLAAGGNDLVLTSQTVGWTAGASSGSLLTTDEFGPFQGAPAIFLNANYGPTTLQGGFVYARVFQDTTPGLGEYFYQSSNQLVTAFTGSEGANTLDINGDNTNGNELNQLIVPEPSVLAFLGAGALVVAYRRMRRS